MIIWSMAISVPSTHNPHNAFEACPQSLSRAQGDGKRKQLAVGVPPDPPSGGTPTLPPLLGGQHIPQDEVVGMPGFVVTAEIRFLDAAAGIDSDAGCRGEPAHHRFVGQHGDGADVLVWHGDDGQFVANKALVLQDDAHVGDTDEASTHADAVVHRIDDLALKQARPDLLQLLWLVVNDVGQDLSRGQSRRGTPWASLRKYSAPARIMMPSMRPHSPIRPNVKMPTTIVRTNWMTPMVV